jgi:undecaprenyl phosphate-alpha-L-ara4FN deformylase
MCDAPATIGLRIDVDTFRGTRTGVPRLSRMLTEHGITASFFFSVGPDNMGRHLWRLIRPAFLRKMFRSRAPGLYGWDILLRGTLWPGAMIGERLADIICATSELGHEVGIHAWDHHAWQVRSDAMSAEELDRHISLGMHALGRILGSAPQCSAAAGWKCTESALLRKESFGMRYHSDCRGTCIFRPTIDGITCTPQIPVTLPTYDEVIGQNGITDDNYNETLLDMIRPRRLNVLAIHAEVEGISKLALFERFLDMSEKRNLAFVTLGALLPEAEVIPSGTISQGTVAGRDGTLCMQSSATV